MPSLAATAALDHGIGEYRLNVLQHVVSDDPDLMATLDTEIGDRQRALQAAFDAYSQYAGSSEGRALYDELGRALTAYFAERATATGFSRQGDAAGAQNHIEMHHHKVGRESGRKKVCQ